MVGRVENAIYLFKSWRSNCLLHPSAVIIMVSPAFSTLSVSLPKYDQKQALTWFISSDAEIAGSLSP